jgi:photosystem II stability/assembly factor-like uncharacterized protein
MGIKNKHLIFFTLLVILVSLFSGCTTDDTANEDTNQGTLEDTTEDENIDNNETEFDEVDNCGNEIGNGAEIISGPSGPEHEGDHDNPFRSLTVHPNNSDIIIVGTERNGFLKSEDGGNTWFRLRYGIRHDYRGYPEIYDISYVNSNPEMIYAAFVEGPGPVAGNYPTSNAGVYKSTDSGQTWSRKNCGLNNGCVTCVHVLSENNIVIGIRGGSTTFTGFDVSGQYFDGGIYRTTNGGTQWSRVNIVENDNLNDYMIIRSAKNNPQLMYSYGFNSEDTSTNVGFIKSNDGGESWTQIAPSLKDKNVSYFDISSDGNTIYATSSYYIHKSTDAGDTWSEYSIQSWGYALDVFPDDSNRVLYSTISGVFLSTDGLSSNKQVLTLENPENHISDIVVSESDSNICYIITVGYDFYKSTDTGASFTKIINLRDEVLNVIL